MPHFQRGSEETMPGASSLYAELLPLFILSSSILPSCILGDFFTFRASSSGLQLDITQSCSLDSIVHC